MKTRLAGAILFVSLCPLAARSAPPQVEPSKAADIQHLIELSGGGEMGASWVTEFTNKLKTVMAQTSSTEARSQKIVDTFVQKLGQQFPSAWMKLLIPIYDRHLTHQEVKELIRFYESPLGRRVKEVMPKIMEEGNAAGLKQGMELIQEILRNMVDDFPELKPNK